MKFAKYFILIFFIYVPYIFAFDILGKQGEVLSSNLLVKERFNTDFISYSDLRDALDLPNKDKYTVIIENTEISILPENSYFAIGNKVYNFPYETLDYKGDIYIPHKYFSIAINDYFGKTIFISTSKSLQYIIPLEKQIVSERPVSTGDFSIEGIEIFEKLNGTLIEIYTKKPFSRKNISSYISADNYLYMTFYKGTVDTVNTELVKLNGAVQKYIPIQNKESSQLTFKLSKQIISNSVDIRKDKITVTLITEKVEIDDNLLTDKLTNDMDKWKIDTIIIDPGHGGKDPGAVSKKGTYEKDIVLKIGLYLKELLEKSGKFKVYMTRDDDTFIGLKDRTKFANEKGGKLFVSIHCNSAKNSKASGFETYFLKPARTERAMKVAAKENASIKYESNQSDYRKMSDEDYIILTMMQAGFAKESEKWGLHVQNEVDKVSTMKNRRVDQAGFYVLIGASMPAILFEAGFISNSTEERLLKTKSYQKKLAKALYDSIVKLKNEVEN